VGGDHGRDRPAGGQQRAGQGVVVNQVDVEAVKDPGNSRACSTSGTGSSSRALGGSGKVATKSAPVRSRPAPMSVTRCPPATSWSTNPAHTASIPP
jgi:hypothetical protein